MTGSAAATAPLTTYAELVWPTRGGAAAWLRAVVLVVLGAALLTISAKVQVPGPVPTTLQTLAVLALGALLGARLAVASVALYLAEGALGLPVFANTPPLAAGIAYLVGPTAGFLAGFAVAAAAVGVAADRGLASRPFAFAAVLLAADAAMLACGWLWLGYGMPVHGGLGLGGARAFAAGIAPFWIGEAVKVALAALALPLALSGLGRWLGRSPDLEG